MILALIFILAIVFVVYAAGRLGNYIGHRHALRDRNELVCVVPETIIVHRREDTVHIAFGGDLSFVVAINAENAEALAEVLAEAMATEGVKS